MNNGEIFQVHCVLKIQNALSFIEIILAKKGHKASFAVEFDFWIKHKLSEGFKIATYLLPDHLGVDMLLHDHSMHWHYDFLYLLSRNITWLLLHNFLTEKKRKLCLKNCNLQKTLTWIVQRIISFSLVSVNSIEIQQRPKKS